MSTAPAIPAAAPRPTNGARANATAPEASATRPTHRANPMAFTGGISSPGSVPKRAPAIQAVTATMTITMSIPVRCANSFSIAIRRSPRGVTATSSMLPRRDSAASVDDRARIDQMAATRPSDAAVFHAIEPPSVSIIVGNGLP